jgi:hypothetical protein
MPAVDLVELAARQRLGLWLDGSPGLDSVPRALAFLEEVAVALRYGAASNLPLASMYRATQRQAPDLEDEQAAHARAFELTNGLLAGGRVIEINLVGSRLVLAHERVMPAIYRLRRGPSEPRLSEPAREALELILTNEQATSGEVRRLLKAEGQPRPDAADAALTELQRELLVDRGPSAGASTGVFYLTREGYPYHGFAGAHPEIVRDASKLARGEAAADLLRQYLRAAVFGTRRKLTSLFQLLLGADEVDAAIESLVHLRQVELQRPGRTEVVVYRVPEL